MRNSLALICHEHERFRNARQACSISHIDLNRVRDLLLQGAGFIDKLRDEAIALDTGIDKFILVCLGQLHSQHGIIRIVEVVEHVEGLAPALGRNIDRIDRLAKADRRIVHASNRDREAQLCRIVQSIGRNHIERSFSAGILYRLNRNGACGIAHDIQQTVRIGRAEGNRIAFGVLEPALHFGCLEHDG